MMRKYFLLLCFVLITVFASAQEFYGGVLAGFNGSQVEGDLAAGYNKLGLVAGAWTQRNISDNFYWGMEVKVNQKGSRVQPTKRNGYWKYVYRLNYIDLPVLVGYQYKPYMSFFTGLSYGYMFHKGGENNYGEDPSVLYDDISKWEMGMFAGVKVAFDRLSNQRWAKNMMLETRYQYSVLSINNAHDLFTYYYSLGQFNNVISIVLYYQIGWPSSK